MSAPRATTIPGFLDVVDVLGRGGTDDWRALYQRAASDGNVRAEVEAALQFVDPELGAARELWAFLLSTLGSSGTELTVNQP